MKRLAVFFVLVLMSSLANAQCKDTLNFPNYQPPCYPDFLPVCGCDGVTYRNSCFADYATVLQYQERPCEQVAMYIYPNPATDILYTTVATKYDADVNIYIYDRNGLIQFYRYFPQVTNQQIYVPLDGLQQGLYIIMAESNGVTKLLKFLKWD
ncbi:MAG: T9SS type A sorting domain-containing protein [Flavobacteriales bacterium]|nr:T9SS type A sorting domain-containing protein [Flavobacteriales bacterium]